MNLTCSKRGRLAYQKAFTLIEVMIAMAVVGILFVSLYAGITSGFGVVNLARENLRATQVLSEKMEEIRLYNWDQMNSFGSSTSFIPATFSAPFFPAAASTNTNASGLGGLVYNGTLSVSNCGLTDVTYSNDLLLVTVSVNWTSGIAPRTRVMQTYVSR